MNGCVPLVKAIDAYLAKADSNLKDELGEAGFANPKDTVKEISSLEDKIAAALASEAEYITSKAKKAVDLNAFAKEWPDIIEDDYTDERLGQIFLDDFKTNIPKLATEYAKKIDPEITVATITERTSAWAENWSEELGRLMKLSTHEEVGKILADGLASGQSVSDFALALMGYRRGEDGDWLRDGDGRAIQIGGIRNEYHRARTVAVTETLRAHSVAQQESMTQNPAVEGKMWRHTGSDNPRQNHVDMDGETVGKDEPFELDGADGATYHPMYPRDPVLPAGECVNCRCICQPVVDEDILGLSLEERKDLQQAAIDADDSEWEKELDAKNKAKAGIDGVSDWDTVLGNRYGDFQNMGRDDKLAYLHNSKPKLALYEAGIIKTPEMLNNVKNNSLTKLRESGIMTLESKTVKHAAVGDFTGLKNPKLPAGGKNGGRMDGGGHGQSGIDELDKRGFEYNIVNTYANGVRIGNVPEHGDKRKQSGTNQAWFPETWTDDDILTAGTYVANTSQSKDVFRFEQYSGVRVGIVVENDLVTTIFPGQQPTA